MHAHGHTTVWGTHIGVDRDRSVTGWYHELKAWWAAHKAARHEVKLAATPLRADAAGDLVAPVHARSIAMALCDLGA